MSSSDAEPYISWLLSYERSAMKLQAIALFLESILFGVFLMTYSIGIWEFLCGNQPSTTRKSNRILIGLNTVMFVLATTHLGLTLTVTFNYVNAIPAALGLYTPVIGSDYTNVVLGASQTCLYVTQTLIGDTFMVYRLYVIWEGKRRVVVLPIFLIIIDAIGGYGTVIGGSISELTFFSSSFCTNMSCTILIMWRLLRGSDGLVHAHWEWHSRVWFTLVRYKPAVEAIIQSAAIYSAASLALIITCDQYYDTGFIVCLSVFSQLIGIVFSIIVIGILRKSAVSNSPEDSRSRPNPTAPISPVNPDTPIRLPELLISGAANQEIEKGTHSRV